MAASPGFIGVIETSFARTIRDSYSAERSGASWRSSVGAAASTGRLSPCCGRWCWRPLSFLIWRSRRVRTPSTALTGSGPLACARIRCDPALQVTSTRWESGTRGLRSLENSTSIARMLPPKRCTLVSFSSARSRSLEPTSVFLPLIVTCIGIAPNVEGAPGHSLRVPGCYTGWRILRDDRSAGDGQCRHLYPCRARGMQRAGSGRERPARRRDVVDDEDPP